jgi:hypothetical protein
MTSVGSIVGGAFGVVFRHPLAVLVWGLLYVAMLALMMLLMWSTLEAIFSTLAKGGNEQAMTAELSRLQVNSGLMTLMQIGMYIVPALAFTAAMRSVLRPEQKGFFYLRLGMDEVRVGAVWFILNMVLGMGMVVAIIPIAIVAAIVGAAGGVAAAVLVSGLLILAALCAFIYFLVRLSLMAPLTFLREEFAFGEAWRITRGHFWTLFGGYFVVAFVQSLLTMAAWLAMMWPLLGDLGQAGFDPARFQEIALAHIQRLARPEVTTVIGWVLIALTSGIGIALYGGAAAAAARDLTGDTQGARRTFA